MASFHAVKVFEYQRRFSMPKTVEASHISIRTRAAKTNSHKIVSLSKEIESSTRDACCPTQSPAETRRDKLRIVVSVRVHHRMQ